MLCLLTFCTACYKQYHEYRMICEKVKWDADQYGYHEADKQQQASIQDNGRCLVLQRFP